MSGDVVLSSAMRTNLLTLQRTQSDIDTVQNRLATGLKVNSALDNPQSFFAAQSLNNRAGDLSRLLDGIGQSIRTIEEADNGITALTDLVQQADSIATEALSEARSAEGFALVRGTEDLRGVTLTDNAAIDVNASFNIFVEEADGATAAGATNVGDDTTSAAINVTIALGDTVDNIVAQINADAANDDLIRASVSSSGQLVIESQVEGASVRVEDSGFVGDAGNVELGAAGFDALGLGSFVQAESHFDPGGAQEVRYGGTAIAGNVITSAQASTGAQTNGVYEASATLAEAQFLTVGSTTDELTVNVIVDGETSANITLADESTIQDFVDGINNDATIGDDVTASFNTTTGRIEIQGSTGTSTVEIQYTDIDGDADPIFNFGTGVNDADVVAAGSTGSVTSEAFTFVGTSTDLAQFESDYNNIRSQIDDLVADASYRGVNLLAGDDLTTFFNEDSTSSLQTEGADFSSAGLGIAEANFTTSASIQLSLDDVGTGLDQVRNFGSSIANDLSIMQTRQNFTSETINTLEAGADDLTVADLNEEGANLLALQTRQQLGTTALSLASQSQQSVLRLF